jgi:hypothetical protein
MIDNQHCQHAEDRNRDRDRGGMAQQTLAHEINPEGGECSCQEAPKPSGHFKSEPTFGQQSSGLQSIRTGSLLPASTRFTP